VIEETFELQVSDFEVELHCALRSVDTKGDEVDLGECLLGLGNAFHLGGALDHQKFVLLPDKRMPAVVRVKGWLEFSLWFEPFVTAQVNVQLEHSFDMPVDGARKGDLFLRAVLADQTRNSALKPPAASLDWNQQLEMRSDRVSGETPFKVQLVQAAGASASPPQRESVVAEWATTVFQLRQEHDHTHPIQGSSLVPKTFDMQPAGHITMALAYRGPKLADPSKTLVGSRRRSKPLQHPQHKAEPPPGEAQKQARREPSSAQDKPETSAKSQEDRKAAVEAPGEKQQSSGAQYTQSEISSESSFSNNESPRKRSDIAGTHIRQGEEDERDLMLSAPREVRTEQVVMHGNPMASEPLVGDERAPLGSTDSAAGQHDMRTNAMFVLRDTDTQEDGDNVEKLEMAHMAHGLLGDAAIPVLRQQSPEVRDHESPPVSLAASLEVEPTQQPLCEAPAISQEHWDDNAPHSSEGEASPPPVDEVTGVPRNESVLTDLREFRRAGPRLSEAHAALALSDMDHVGEDVHENDIHMVPHQTAVDVHADDNTYTAAPDQTMENLLENDNMHTAPNQTTEDLREDDNIHVAPNQTADELHDDDNMHAPPNQTTEDLREDDNIHVAPNQTADELHDDDNMHAPPNQTTEDLREDSGMHVVPNQTMAEVHAVDSMLAAASNQTAEDLHEDANIHVEPNETVDAEMGTLNDHVMNTKHHTVIESQATTSKSSFLTEEYFHEEVHVTRVSSSVERTEFQGHSAHGFDSTESEDGDVFFTPLGAKRPADDSDGTSPMSQTKPCKADLDARTDSHDANKATPTKIPKSRNQLQGDKRRKKAGSSSASETAQWEVSSEEVEVIEPDVAANKSPLGHNLQEQSQAQGRCDEEMKKALEEAEAMRLAAEQEIAKLAAEKSALTRESEEARAEQEAIALVAAQEHQAALAAQEAAAQAIQEAERLKVENELTKAAAEEAARAAAAELEAAARAQAQAQEALDKAQAELQKEQDDARRAAVLQAELEEAERLAEFKRQEAEAARLAEEEEAEAARLAAEQQEAARLAAEAEAEEQAKRVKAGVGSRCTAADYALVARRRAHEERRRLKAEAKKQAQREAEAAEAAAKQSECMAEESKRRAQENAKRRAARLAAQNSAKLAQARAAASAELRALESQKSQAVVVKQRQAVYAASVASKNSALSSSRSRASSSRGSSRSPTPERSRDGVRHLLPSPIAASTPPESPVTPLPVSVPKVGACVPHELVEQRAPESPEVKPRWSWWWWSKNSSSKERGSSSASAATGAVPAREEDAAHVQRITDALYGDVYGVLADLEAWRREQQISPYELWTLMDTHRSGYLEIDEFVSFIRSHLQPPDFPGCTAVQLSRFKHLLLSSLGSEATVREGWVATMLQQHKDVETWNTPDTHNLRSLAQALGPEHEAKVMACLGVRASHDGTMEVSDMHQELGRECTGLPPLVLQSALGEVGRVCEKAGKVRVADVALVMRIVWHYQVSSTSTTTSKSTSTAASSAEGFTPLWRRVLGTGPPSAQSSPGADALALPVLASDATNEQLAAKPPQEWNIESPEVTSVTLFDEARTDVVVDVMYGSVDELFAALEAYRTRRRYRAVDMFMEIDKDHSGEIDIKELIHFVRRVVPDMTEVQMRRLYRRLDQNRDGKVTYKEVANYMSMNHNVEHAARMSTSHMRKAVIHMGLQMDDVFRRLAGWRVDQKGQISHEELRRNLAAELSNYTASHLRHLTAELLSVVDQGGRVAVYDVIVVLKAVWLHEVQAV